MCASSTPLVTVITPFYNSEQYLAECIESVIAQTHNSWEYFLVDNCSTDRSYEIACSYRDRDRRITVIQNATFLGQVQNYNQALRLVSPESSYCKIVQADDWIFKDCLSEMVLVAQQNPTVGIVGSYWLNGTQVKGSGLEYPSTVVSGKNICRWHLLSYPEKYLFGTPTSLLFRSDFVRGRDPFYCEASLLEDYEVCYDLLKTSDFGFVHKVLTFSRVSEESLTGQIRSFEPYLLHAFICIRKYGPLYLTQQEYHQRLRIISDRYFTALAQGILHRSGRDFWEYHTQGLRYIGFNLGRKTLARYVILEFLDIVRHPKALIALSARWLNASRR
jgi:glycosyltransferase involved in cell wall biosynthesis